MALDIIGHINEEVTSLTTEKKVATTEQKVALLNDLCATHGYQEQVTNDLGELINNPETKKQFANRMIVNQIKRWINGWRRSKAVIIFDEIDIS